MNNRLDLVGQRFGRLEVKEFVGLDKSGNSYWNCICDCGNLTKVLGLSLRSGGTRSCGCYKKERGIEANTTHGHCKAGLRTKEYRQWSYMMERCYNPKNKRYKDYGGRGIKVCERWHKFENFYEDVGASPEGMTFDRTGNDGDYEPGNWRWATPREQCNNRRSNVWLKHKGETKNITQWASSLDINYKTLYNRLKRWSVERALTTPVRS